MWDDPTLLRFVRHAPRRKTRGKHMYMCVLKRERHLENYGLQHANVINVGNNSVTRTYARTHIWIFNFAPCLSVSLSR